MSPREDALKIYDHCMRSENLWWADTIYRDVYLRRAHGGAVAIELVILEQFSKQLSVNRTYGCSS